MESMSERFARIEREREEQLQQYKLEQQLKIKKMTKLIGGSVLGLLVAFFLAGFSFTISSASFNSCLSTIPPLSDVT